MYYKFSVVLWKVCAEEDFLSKRPNFSSCVFFLIFSVNF